MDLVPILSLIILVATVITLILAVIAYARYKWREQKRAENSDQVEVVETVQRQEPAYVLATPSNAGYVQPSYAEPGYDEAYGEQSYYQEGYQQGYDEAYQEAYAQNDDYENVSVQPSYDPRYAEEAVPEEAPAYAYARGQQSAQADARSQPPPQAQPPQPSQQPQASQQSPYGVPQPIMPQQRSQPPPERDFDVDDFQPLQYDPRNMGPLREANTQQPGSFPEATIVPSQMPPGGARKTNLRPPRTDVPQQPPQRRTQRSAPDPSRSLFWEYGAEDGPVPVDSHHLNQRGRKKPTDSDDDQSDDRVDWL